ncbi:MAG TPA: AMP-binding protein, partial [Gemmatimonadaceae bacterium]|nr:AMP-binding protein [Gemmatimonadaceae bacterium]
MSDDLQVLLTEHRKFDPPAEFRADAAISSPAIYDRGSENMERYWGEQGDKLEWITRYSKVLDWQPPHAKWFVGGTLNVSVNCLDRHVRGARRNKAALVFEGEPGDRRTLTYWDLYVQVNQFANVLKSLGVKKGDRVAIYLPLIPEAAVAMLACARIGAIHSVVFGGFSPESLRDRINDSQCKVLVTADGGYRRGSVVPLKRNSDKALEETPSIQH